MQIIPVQDVPAQTFDVLLGGQQTTINIYMKSTGMFLDVLVSNVLVVAGVICQNLNRIVRDEYLGFVGDLLWQDTQGSSDPSSPGLGTRYQFYYLEAADVAAIQAANPLA